MPLLLPHPRLPCPCSGGPCLSCGELAIDQGERKDDDPEKDRCKPSGLAKDIQDFTQALNETDPEDKLAI